MDGLTIAAACFFLGGAFRVAIAALTPWFGDPPPIVGLSARTDEVRWGRPSAELLADPVVRDLRLHHHSVVQGLLAGLGILEMAMAWFAVRQAPWAFWTLAASGGVMALAWLAMARPFWKAGARVGLLDLQPFAWIPAVLWLVGTLAGLVHLA